MAQDVLEGVAVYAVIAFAPLLVLLAVRRGRRLVVPARALLVRLHCWPRPPVLATAAPLEEVVATLRRLYPVAHHPPRGAGMPRQRGALMAYDERLAAAACALEVPTALTDLPLDTVDREAERLRLEDALGRAGLVWRADQGWPPDRAA
jgi:hypothetical protein